MGVRRFIRSARYGKPYLGAQMKFPIRVIWMRNYKKNKNKNKKQKANGVMSRTLARALYIFSWSSEHNICESTDRFDDR